MVCSSSQSDTQPLCRRHHLRHLRRILCAPSSNSTLQHPRSLPHRCTYPYTRRAPLPSAPLPAPCRFLEDYIVQCTSLYSAPTFEGQVSRVLAPSYSTNRSTPICGTVPAASTVPGHEPPWTHTIKAKPQRSPLSAAGAPRLLLPSTLAFCSVLLCSPRNTHGTGLPPCSTRIPRQPRSRLVIAHVF